MGNNGGTGYNKNVEKVIQVNGVEYTTDTVLGKGGFATVYGALSRLNGNPVAIKETRLAEIPSHKMRNSAMMYLNEIILLKQLRRCVNFENIVGILDYDFDAKTGNAYLVEERGIPFEQIVGKRSRVIGEPKRLSYFKGMANAVDILHSVYIVHADLKPANFIVVDCKIKIIDLGTSFLLPDPKMSADRNAIGTPGYMAPEQRGVRGKASYGLSCDIYSLGAILYEMTFGKRLQSPPTNKPIPLHKNPYLHDMLVLCLQFSPGLRPNIKQVLSHPYMRLY